MAESLDGATMALHRRIEELTAELAEAMRSGEVVAGLLATERAAREQLDADWKRRHTEWLDKALVDAQWHRDQLQQAERERDTALARAEAAERGEADAVKACDDNWVTHQRVVAAETALASALARVKELEDKVIATQRACDVHRTRAAAEALKSDQECQAAETALASALAMLDQPVPLLTADGLLKRITDLRKLLSSQPAPVAIPASDGTPVLCHPEFAAAHSADPDLWQGAVDAAAPAAAPCAACGHDTCEC